MSELVISGRLERGDGPLTASSEAPSAGRRGRRPRGAVAGGRASRGATSWPAPQVHERRHAAFPGSKNADAGIDFGDLTLLAEVVTTQVALPTRESADVAAFGKDIEKFFLKKAGQLDETAANLLRDSQPADSPLDGPARQILPVVVRGGQFPINPVTRRHIEDALQNGGLLNYRRPAAPIARIAPLDLEELEICETLRETRNLALHDLIRQWQQSADYAESSFRSFLSQANGGPFARPADLQAELARTLSLIAERLGSDWTPGARNPGQSAGLAGTE